MNLPRPMSTAVRPICVAQAFVVESVRTRMLFDYEDLGLQELNGFEHAVRPTVGHGPLTVSGITATQ